MELKEFMETIGNTLIKAKVINFFYNNRYSIDTPQGFSIWLNEDAQKLSDALESLAKDGILFNEFGMFGYKPKAELELLIEKFVEYFNSNEKEFVGTIKTFEDREAELLRKLEEVSKELYEKNRALFILQEINNTINSPNELYEIAREISNIIKNYLNAYSISFRYKMNNISGEYFSDEQAIRNNVIESMLSFQEDDLNISTEEVNEADFVLYGYKLREESGTLLGKMIVSVRQGKKEEFLKDKELLHIISSIFTQALEKHNYFFEKMQKEKFESDLKIAEKIQRSYIPESFPNIQGLEFSAMYEPARIVGGDYYDWFKVDDTKYSFLIGDVSGKGTGAALFMVKARENFRIFSKNNLDPGNVLALVNQSLISDVEVDKFITVFYLIYDTKTKKISFANAGHDPLLILRNNEFIISQVKGPPLGILEGYEYVNQELILEDRDTLVFYTDGLVEARNTQKEFYDFDRFYKVIKDNNDKSTREVVDSISKDVKAFVGEAPQHDDFTLMVVKYNSNNN